jgi:hypothetical protein
VLGRRKIFSSAVLRFAFRRSERMELPTNEPAYSVAPVSPLPLRHPASLYHMINYCIDHSGRLSDFRHASLKLVVDSMLHAQWGS